MALAIASAGTTSPWLLGAALTPDVLSVVNAVKEDNGLGVISGLAGFGGAVAAFKSASATADVLLKIEKYASRAELAFGGASAFADCEDGEECFVPGTKVLTKSGRKAIEELKLGDEVLSRDEETGQQAYKPVKTRFRGQTSKVVRLTLVPRQARQNGRSERHSVGSTKTGNSEEGSDSDPDPDAQNLRCTPKHPFYVQGRGWIQAEFLNVGDELVGSEGGDWQVAETKLVWESSETYNLEVADWHTFFVVEGNCGREGLWVHNVSTKKHFDSLRNYKKRLGKAPAPPKTVGKLVLGGNEYFGRSSRRRLDKSSDAEFLKVGFTRQSDPTKLPANWATRNHAEGHAFLRAFNFSEQGQHNTGRWYVDRPLCGFCGSGPGQSRGLESLARELGLKKLIVYSPDPVTNAIIKQVLKIN